MTFERITFEALRCNSDGEKGRIVISFDGDLLLSDETSETQGLLQQFKSFALALGYHPNSVDRLVYLEPEEMVADRDWYKSDEKVPVGKIIEMLKSDSADIAVLLLDNESHIRAIATEISKSKKGVKGETV